MAGSARPWQSPRLHTAGRVVEFVDIVVTQLAARCCAVCSSPMPQRAPLASDACRGGPVARPGGRWSIASPREGL
jgi:hypothetical protein